MLQVKPHSIVTYSIWFEGCSHSTTTSVAVHTKPKKFDTGVFTLKTYQMFSVYTRPEKTKNTTIHGHFGSVFEGISVKPRPNDRTISTQHVATLLGATCCVRLATELRRAATCCNMLGVVRSSLEMVKFSFQHLWVLHDVVIVWPGSYNIVAPRHAQ